MRLNQFAQMLLSNCCDSLFQHVQVGLTVRIASKDVTALAAAILLTEDVMEHALLDGEADHIVNTVGTQLGRKVFETSHVCRFSRSMNG